MFCRECGKMVQDGNKFCTGCGSKIVPIAIKKNTVDKINVDNKVNNNVNEKILKSNDKYSVGFNILSFFVPIVGLVLFLVMKKETPKKAKGIGISALVGYVVSMIISVLYVIFVFWLAFSYPATVYENEKQDKEYHDNYYDEKYDFEKDYEFNGSYNI